MDSLQAEIAARDSVLRAIGARDVTVLNLTSGSTAPSGRMFWDRARGSWTFLAQNLPPLQPGRTYQLWIVTNKAKISAGTFEPRNGEATVSAQLVLTEPLAAVAVTEEPAGGTLQPTGATVIAATLR
jgi:anti-sigma-K factor RskA